MTEERQQSITTCRSVAMRSPSRFAADEARREVKAVVFPSGGVNEEPRLVHAAWQRGLSELWAGSAVWVRVGAALNW